MDGWSTKQLAGLQALKAWDLTRGTFGPKRCGAHPCHNQPWEPSVPGLRPDSRAHAAALRRRLRQQRPRPLLPVSLGVHISVSPSVSKIWDIWVGSSRSWFPSLSENQSYAGGMLLQYSPMFDLLGRLPTDSCSGGPTRNRSHCRLAKSPRWLVQWWTCSLTRRCRPFWTPWRCKASNIAWSWRPWSLKGCEGEVMVCGCLAERLNLTSNMHENMVYCKWGPDHQQRLAIKHGRLCSVYICPLPSKIGPWYINRGRLMYGILSKNTTWVAGYLRFAMIL